MFHRSIGAIVLGVLRHCSQTRGKHPPRPGTELRPARILFLLWETRLKKAGAVIRCRRAGAGQRSRDEENTRWRLPPGRSGCNSKHMFSLFTPAMSVFPLPLVSAHDCVCVPVVEPILVGVRRAALNRSAHVAGSFFIPVKGSSSEPRLSSVCERDGPVFGSACVADGDSRAPRPAALRSASDCSEEKADHKYARLWPAGSRPTALLPRRAAAVGGGVIFFFHSASSRRRAEGKRAADVWETAGRARRGRSGHHQCQTGPARHLIKLVCDSDNTNMSPESSTPKICQLLRLSDGMETAARRRRPVRLSHSGRYI